MTLVPSDAGTPSPDLGPKDIVMTQWLCLREMHL